MAAFFTGIDGRAPDEGFLLLEEVFHLEDQLPPENNDAADNHVQEVM